MLILKFAFPYKNGLSLRKVVSTKVIPTTSNTCEYLSILLPIYCNFQNSEVSMYKRLKVYYELLLYADLNMYKTLIYNPV